MKCPNCDAEMESRGASGTQYNAVGAAVDVSVSWDVCPDCATVVDPNGNVVEAKR